LVIDALPSTRRSSTKGCSHDQPGVTTDPRRLNNKLKATD
jgi:hypothetical protein